jgi:GTP-binding protein HflX
VIERRRRERAVIGAVRLPSQRRFQVEESLDELAALVTAAGAEVAGRVIQERAAPTPALYFGRGKIEEIGEMARAQGANLFVSDDALSPVQERNISETSGLKVIDRTALILDIFAQRARTAEGKLQVELAQLTYLLPRLVGQWKHLERLGGGIGTRGPGETQLETDRRIIQKRVQRIRRDLEGVATHRRLQRKGRRRHGVPVVALVGYTNAGKTTLMNRLTGSQLHAADQLFVTLDPAARLVDPGASGGSPGRHIGKPFILTDTVGFIRKLPHELVAAFRATLEELGEADVLLHVVDASQPALEDHLAAVESLLEELEVGDRPTILVLNKLDRVASTASVESLMASRPRVVGVSARTGKGIESLLAAIQAALRPSPAVTAANSG